MKLYYSGTDLSDSQIRCYDANFEDLGDDFKCGFQKGVLTIRADFAERISGLMIRKSNDSFIFQLRYLDSEQFAWLAQVFAYDEGWSQYGDTEAYYSAEERKALEDKAAAGKVDFGANYNGWRAHGAPRTVCEGTNLRWMRTIAV